MAGFPTKISRAQLRAACEALGIPPELVAEMRLPATGDAEITVYVRNREGRGIVRGEGALTAVIRLPIN